MYSTSIGPRGDDDQGSRLQPETSRNASADAGEDDLDEDVSVDDDSEEEDPVLDEQDLEDNNLTEEEAEDIEWEEPAR